MESTATVESMKRSRTIELNPSGSAWKKCSSEKKKPDPDLGRASEICWHLAAKEYLQSETFKVKHLFSMGGSSGTRAKVSERRVSEEPFDLNDEVDQDWSEIDLLSRIQTSTSPEVRTGSPCFACS